MRLQIIAFCFQLLYRLYPVHELPKEEDKLLQWVYERYIEKESLLDEYYATGEFPTLDPTQCHGQLLESKRYTQVNLPVVVVANVLSIGTVYVAWQVIMWLLTPFSFVLSFVW